MACTKAPSGDAVRENANKTETKTDAPGDETSKPVAAAGGLMELPEIVATVGEASVSRSEFAARYDPQAKMILARRDDGLVPNAYQAQQRRKIIGELAWAKQMELEAARSKVDFDPELMAKTEANERRHILDWDAWLARINQTQAIRHQANVVYLRERALFAARELSIEPSEEELRALYEKTAATMPAPQELVRASHILLAHGPRIGDEKIQPPTYAEREAATPEQIAQWELASLVRIQALRELVIAEKPDFNDFAKEYSEGPGAYRGGDMGLFPNRQMVPAYTEAAWALEPGEISQPVKDEKGYYVIKSFGHFQEGETLPYEAVRPDLERQLQSEKYKAAKATLAAELDERYPIVSAVLDEAKAYKGR